MRDDSIKNNKPGEEPKNYAPRQSAEEAKNRVEKPKRPDALSGMVFHAMRMMAGTLVSRVLGLVREMLTSVPAIMRMAWKTMPESASGRFAFST